MKLFFLLLIGVIVSAVAADLQVTVYDGPTECSDNQRVQSGDRLEMHYTGTIDESSETGTPGNKFDSSRDRGRTFEFTIGQGEVIQGWDQGILGLCLGAKAILIIPPDMGYGSRGAGDVIPGGATLNFDVEVVDITNRDTDDDNSSSSSTTTAASSTTTSSSSSLFMSWNLFSTFLPVVVLFTGVLFG